MGWSARTAAASAQAESIRRRSRGSGAAANKSAIMAFKPLIIKVIETGQIDKYLKAYSSQGGLISEVEGAVYAAFGDGLHAAFYLSAALVILAGLLAALTLGNRPSRA